MHRIEGYSPLIETLAKTELGLRSKPEHATSTVHR
jgi:hypothetical protein